MRKLLTTLLCTLAVITTFVCAPAASGASAPSSKPAAAPNETMRSDIPAILVDGPAVLCPGEKIYLRVPRVLDAVYGEICLDGLELMSAAPRGALLFMTDGSKRLVLGPWCDYAEFAFRVTAPTGGTATFQVSNVSVLDSGKDERTSDIIWRRTVSLATEVPSDIESLSMAPNSPYSVIRRDGQLYVMGAELGAGGLRPTAGELCAQFEQRDHAHLLVVSPQGSYLSPDELVRTGDRIRLISDRHYVYWEASVVVRGDVLGTGVLSISQVARVASALRGDEPLEGAYLCAGDWSDTGVIGISDLVRQSQLLRLS